MRRNYLKWVAAALMTFLVVFLLFWVIGAYSSPENPVAIPEEEAVETLSEQTESAESDPYVGSVQTVGIREGLLVAHINCPGAGSLHWEDSKGMVASDTFTWEQPLIGDIELSPMNMENTGLTPVLTTPQGVVKGNSIPIP